jgi:hypothetical protein
MRRTYVGWVTASDGGEVRLAAYDHDSGDIEEVMLARLHEDDHAAPSLHFLPSGRLMVFYSAHNGMEMYYRISVRPEDITDWGEEYSLGVNTPGKGFTYPNPVQLSDEDDRLYLFWRGGSRQPTYSHTEDYAHWAPAKNLIEAGTVPYLKVFSSGQSTIHFGFSNDHPELASNNNIYYFAYRNGQLFRADGSLIGALDAGPVTPDDADLVYESSQEDRRAWIWDVAEDKDKNPILVFSASTHPPEHDRRYGHWNEEGWRHHYYYARWDGKCWRHSELVDGGTWFPQTPKDGEEPEPYYSGGIALDHGDPSVVYLSREVNGCFEIERWKTPDGGLTWKSESVTKDSTALNIRPVVPRGPRHKQTSVFWMHGTYRYFTDYDTELKMGL